MTSQLEVRAAVWRAPGARASVETVALDLPHHGEVLVQVAAAGVCHSDLHLAEGHLGERRFPTVLGHEGAGVVEAVGPGVEHVRPGDRVALCFIASCGSCRRCRSGHANLCEPGSAASFRGTMLDGTRRLHASDGTDLKHFLGVACFAERCVVPAASAVPIPPGLPLWEASLAGCAAVTGMGAVRNAAHVHEGDAAVVVGCGGVGLQVVAGLALAGAAPIVAVDRTAEKLERALAHGATAAVEADADDVLQRIRSLTEGGADHAFEVVGQPDTIRLAYDVLRPGGTAVVVGIVPIGVDVAIPAIEFSSEKSLRGSFYGSGSPASEIAAIADLVAEGRLDLASSVSHLTDLDGIEEAFARLRAGDGARTVVVLDHTLAEAPASV